MGGVILGVSSGVLAFLLVRANIGLLTLLVTMLAPAACLHDIGKIGVPAAVMQKREKLTNEERTLVNRHPEIGGQPLQEAKQLVELF